MEAEIAQHSVVQFEEEIDEVRSLALRMGGVVEERVSRMFAALIESDNDTLRWVVDSDSEVNQLELDIDQKCADILARRQPVARDLRLIISIIKIITDLERVGDEAQKIAELMGQQSFDSVPKSLARTMNHLGNSVVQLLHDAIDSFARTETGLAREVVERDRDVDEEYNAAVRQLITYLMQEPRYLSHILNVIWCARSLERIGDHAKNIAEYVIYMVEAKDVRHRGSRG